MKNDVNAILDDLLGRWHRWASAAPSVRGYAPLAAGCWGYRASRQYDDQNGALDSDLADSTMTAVDFQVSEMAEPWRSAIYCNARNISTGRRVWSHPRLPADRAERAALVAFARDLLQKRLIGAGVM